MNSIYFFAVPAMCSFDSTMCDFTNNDDHHGKWVRMKATKDQVDHTYGTENGEEESQYICTGFMILPISYNF